MKRILLSVLGISACTTLSLFAAKSDNLCPKCRAQAEVAAYDDDDDNEEEAMKPVISPEGRQPQTPSSNLHVKNLESMSPRGQQEYLRNLTPADRRNAVQLYNARHPEAPIK